MYYPDDILPGGLDVVPDSPANLLAACATAEAFARLNAYLRAHGLPLIGEPWPGTGDGEVAV